VVGASAAASARLTSSKAQNPPTSPKPAAQTAAALVQQISTSLGSPSQSATRPPKGPASNFSALPAAKTVPRSAGVSPRASNSGGRKGIITPKAANCAA
jgi:hypothetical protein